jgi:ADP-heptose:LPS heptosyltransferase
MNDVKIKFLIVRFSSIGDIVLTTPIVRCLKQQVEGATVHYLTKPQYASFLKDNPYIDKVHTLQSFKETIDEIRNENFDYFIDLHKSIRSLRFKNKLKILDFTFPKFNLQKWLLVNFKINKLPGTHIVDRYFEAVKLFDVENDNKGLDFFINEFEFVNISQYNIPNIDECFVTFAIGGQHQTKKLPNNKIIEICNKINYPVLLLGGKEDYDNAQEIALKSKNTFNLCGELSISQSASVISQSAMVITHDTGLMHIAAAFKKDIVSVWGNTVPEFGMYPYLSGSNSKIFEIIGLKCRPCSKIGYGKCPKKHFNCMNLQDLNKISDYSNKILSK